MKTAVTATALCALLATLSGCKDNTAILALGTLDQERYQLTAPISETLHTIHVEEGQTVTAGQVVVTLDSSLADHELNTAQAQLTQATSQLEELENGARPEELAAAKALVAAQQAAVDDANNELHRVQQLVDSGALGSAELDRAQANQQIHAAQLDNAQQQLLLLKAGTRQEQIKQARAAVESAHAQWQAAQYKRQQISIVAPINGLIDSLPWHQGERVAAGATVVVMLSTPSYARVYLPETQRRNVDVGDELLLRIDGEPASVAGTVRRIGKTPIFTPYYALDEKERARLMFETEIQLKDYSRSFPVGLPVEVLAP